MTTFQTLAELITASAVKAFEDAAADNLGEAEVLFRAHIKKVREDAERELRLAQGAFEKSAERALGNARQQAKNTANKAAVHILQEANISGIQLSLHL